MIGLAVSSQDLAVAEEFFELFKTPWERVVPGRKYRVVLATIDKVDEIDAELLFLYSAGELPLDRKAGIKATQLSGQVDIEWKQGTFPVYGGVGILESDSHEGHLKFRGKAVDYRSHIEGRVVWRIGYDLFAEVRHMLTKGQPAAHALTPTLELHIEVLRHLLIESKIPFVEIPPRPVGFDFICCLTHDVDFFGIRRHKFDRTLAGFLYRSSVGTLVDLVRGRRSFDEAVRNWLAFCALPLVLVGVLPDFWRPFEDYAKVENRRRSTFFLVPFKGKPGVSPAGTLNSWRATPYGICDVQEKIKDAAICGSELGVHGIDAWRDAEAGREEMRQLTFLTGQKSTGIRMHWLYFDENSPGRLEEAGFDYDSTWGYNEAVGYRAGTSQVFRPLTTKVLLELPMSIMDSALFSPGRMGLAYKDGADLCGRIVANARLFGGTVVINWHERSLAPERLWGRAYEELLEKVQVGGRGWFVTAGEAVDWFRWRRSIQFLVRDSSGTTHVEVSAPRSIKLGTVIHAYRPELSGAQGEDVSFDGSVSIAMRL